MTKPVTLLLLYGGKSGEHEISLISAASVLKHLDATKYQIIPIGMDKNGLFYENDYQELIRFDKSLPVITPSSRPFPGLFTNGGLAIEADVVFPVVHGPLYEDGCLQGLLSLANVAYVGCDVRASAIGMDKDLTRRLVGNHCNVRSANYRSLSWHAPAAEKQRFCQQVSAALGWPLFVKPCTLGSSVGIHKVNNMAELTAAIEDALRYDEAILVEEAIQGREIELAVLENSLPFYPPHVSLAGEIRVNHVDGFYSYSAKYLESHDTHLLIPANHDKPLVQELQQFAAEIFTSLKCKGMARIDFFVNDNTNTIYFNEISSLPGFTSISMYPKLWEASGLSYPALLDRLIELAMLHYRCRQQLVTDYQ